MYLYINFHKLSFTQDSSYAVFSEWIPKKKTVTNPKQDDEQCFKGAVVAALLHEYINHNPGRTSLPQHYED